jgi:hypothetical protein
MTTVVTESNRLLSECSVGALWRRSGSWRVAEQPCGTASRPAAVLQSTTPAAHWRRGGLPVSHRLDRILTMSQEYENASQCDSMPDDAMLDDGAAMRGGFGGWTRWSEEEHTKTDIRECTDQHCMNVEVNCGFQGLDPGSPLSQSAGVSGDLRAAWRAKLEGEGKSISETQSLRDICLCPAS